MPKRAATPPIDDEAKYLTVVNPYPARPNLRLVDYQRQFARWIAACIGSHELFRAFYYRLISPGSVIIEVDENLSKEGFKRLLGKHKWAEFLKDPKGVEAQASMIYYCTYNSDRVVQKNGWKRVDVQDAWFKSPSKAGARFVFPYPETQYCDLPKGSDAIQADLCRPLPGRDFPPPPPPRPPPVVGTMEWLKWKGEQDDAQTYRTWLKNASPEEKAKIWASTNGGSPNSSSSSGHSTPSSIVAPKPVVSQAWSTATSPSAPPGLPPGLFRLGTSPSIHHPPSSIEPMSPLSPPTASSSSASGDLLPRTPVDSVAGDNVAISGERIEYALSELALDYGEEDFYSAVGASDYGETQDLVIVHALQVEPSDELVEVQGSLWADYTGGAEEDDDALDDTDDEDEAKTNMSFLRASAKNPLLCTEHNQVCARGVCKVYGEMIKRQRQIERGIEHQREREKREKKKVEKAKKGKNGFFKDSPTSFAPRAPPLPAPAHLLAGAPPPPPDTVRPLPPYLSASAPPSCGSDIAASEDDARSQTSWGTNKDRPDEWGAPPPTRPVPKQLPAHLMRGAAPANPSAVSPAAPRGPAAPTQPVHDDALSISSGGWGSSIPDRPQDWLPAPTKAKAATKAQQQQQKPPQGGRMYNPAAGRGGGPGAPNAKNNHPPPPRAWGAAPSISASSVRRNQDSWSQSARGAAPPPVTRSGTWSGNAGAGRGQTKPWGAWGGAPSISASSIRRNDDSWSQSGADEEEREEWPMAASVSVRPTGTAPAPQSKASGGSAKRQPPAAPSAAGPVKSWGAWGRAPSISASSVQRNNNSWSQSGVDDDDEDEDDDGPTAANVRAAAAAASRTQPAKDKPRVASPRPAPSGKIKPWGAWGRAPSVSASSVQRNNDSWSQSGVDEDDGRSVAESEAAGWGAAAAAAAAAAATVVPEPAYVGRGAGHDGPWGSSDTVRAARPWAMAREKTWADEMDEMDAREAAGVDVETRSVVAPTDTWGNPSVGPW